MPTYGLGAFDIMSRRNRRTAEKTLPMTMTTPVMLSQLRSNDGRPVCRVGVSGFILRYNLKPTSTCGRNPLARRPRWRPLPPARQTDRLLLERPHMFDERLDIVVAEPLGGLHQDLAFLILQPFLDGLERGFIRQGLLHFGIRVV